MSPLPKNWAVMTYDNTVDKHRLRWRKHRSSIMYHLPALTVPAHHELSVGALALRLSHQRRERSGTCWISAFEEAGDRCCIIDLRTQCQHPTLTSLHRGRR